MRRSWLLCGFLALLPIGARATDAPLTVAEPDLPIREVTVFSDRARVVRRGELDVDRGQHTLTLPRLPQTTDPQSVRVEATGARIVRVAVRLVTQDALPKTEAQRLLDHITTLRDDEAALTDHRDTLQSERQFLDSIRPHGEPTGAEKLPPLLLNATGWSAALDFLDARRIALDAALAEVTEKIRLKEREIKTADAQARQLLGQGGDDTGFLVDVVLEGTGAAAHLSLSYVAAGARWYPAYDVRYTPGTKSVEVGFSGLVAQETGESWTDAQLTLSTAVPANVTNLPKLAVWKIGDQERFIPTPEAGPQEGTFAPFLRSAPATPEEKPEEDLDEDQSELADERRNDNLRAQLEAAVAETSRAHEEEQQKEALQFEARSQQRVASRSVSGNAPLAQEITLGVGTQKEISISGTIKRVAVGDAEVMDARTVGPSELLVLGVATGQTTLLVWLENGTRLSYLVKVRKRDVDSIARELAGAQTESMPAAQPAPPPPPAPTPFQAATAMPAYDAAADQAYRRAARTKSFSWGSPASWTPPTLAGDLPAMLAGGYEFTYASAQPESIRTGAEARRVPLFTESYPAESWLKILPALSHSAYLVAEVTNSGATPWLQGQAHLFVGADLVGDAAVPTTAPGEKVTLPLGIDDAIKVERNVQVVSTERGVFTKQDVSEYQVVIEVLNTRRAPVSVRVFDQIPLPQQKEVEIKLTKAEPPPDKDEKALREEGHLEWRAEPGAGEKRSFHFTYEVARPKGWQLWQTSSSGVSP